MQASSRVPDGQSLARRAAAVARHFRRMPSSQSCLDNLFIAPSSLTAAYDRQRPFEVSP
jgi:hypothetical protein